MSPTISVPGVYAQEIPSGAHTITGVPTSITAFVGRTATGPVNQPVTISSYSDFAHLFGDGVADRPLSYAVRDFYLNGGGQAIVVRLYAMPDIAADAVATLSVGSVTLEAASPGVWGQTLRVAVDGRVADSTRPGLGLGPNDPLFNLTIRCGWNVERFLNLTFADTDRRVDRVLAARSVLVRWSGDAPTGTTAFPELAVWVQAYKDLADARAATPPVQASIDAAQVALDEAAAALTDAASQTDANLAAALDAGDPARIATARAAVTEAENAMKGDDGKMLAAGDYAGSQAEKTGLYALDSVDLFNLLCVPPDERGRSVDPAVWQAAMAYCQGRRAFLLVDAPFEWSASPATAAMAAASGLAALGLVGDAARNAAIYFPALLEADVNDAGHTTSFAPCGAVAGIITRIDASRGVWKAPAGQDAAINGVQGLAVELNDADNGMLAPLGINCLRSFAAGGLVIWGARTLRGADTLADDYKYIPVRRTALFIEESLYRGLGWAVFEPNDEALWSQIRLDVGTFMNGLFRQGAFQGATSTEAHLVKCDEDTTPQTEIDRGMLNIVVGFAPLKPAEFVIIQLQLIVGQIRV